MNMNGLEDTKFSFLALVKHPSVYSLPNLLSRLSGRSRVYWEEETNTILQLAKKSYYPD